MSGIYKSTRQAIAKAFDRDTLRIALKEELNVNFDDVVGTDDNFGVQVFDLLEYATKEGRLVDLLSELSKLRPDNKEFQKTMAASIDELRKLDQLADSTADLRANLEKELALDRPVRELQKPKTVRPGVALAIGLAVPVLLVGLVAAGLHVFKPDAISSIAKSVAHTYRDASEQVLTIVAEDNRTKHFTPLQFIKVRYIVRGDGKKRGELDFKNDVYTAPIDLVALNEMMTLELDDSKLPATQIGRPGLVLTGIKYQPNTVTLYMSLEQLGAANLAARDQP